MELNKIYNENCLDTLRRMPDEFIDCVVTSPPYYGLRDYGHDEQMGLEPTFQEYLAKMIEVFAEVKRVLKKTGTCFVNLGDSYGTNSGNARSISKGKITQYGEVDYHNDVAPFIEKPKALHKSLLNIPARFAIAMTDELQFIQRNEIIWHKPACMPSSATDRFTVDFEKIFFFTKSEKYWFEQQKEQALNAGKIVSLGAKSFSKGSALGLGIEPSGNGKADFYNVPETRNVRTTWTVPFEPQSEAHYASYPTRLIETPIKAGCPVGGIVYEPFCGTGTTLVVAHKLGRQWIGSEISAEYVEIAESRMKPLLMQESLFA